MDTNIDDKMYHQIERKLSNNIDENLFSSGRIYDNDNKSVMGNSMFDHQFSDETEAISKDYSNEWRTQNGIPQLSRAEYIRQAREACLRQMSVQSAGRSYEVYDMVTDTPIEVETSAKKKTRMRLFHDDLEVGAVAPNKSAKEENTPQEVAAFRSLIIRMVCAIVLFLGVFVINKFELKFGKLNSQIIKEYVTGNDSLKQLENIIVTWLK